MKPMKAALAGLVMSFGFCPLLAAQNSAANPASKPIEHVLGTITQVDSAAHTITVKDDKTSTEYLISVAQTRTLLKVVPGAKDLKEATRITSDDLSVADRVDVRGFKDPSGANTLTARSVVLMSARELQRQHQAEANAWENSLAGTVISVDSTNRTLVLTTKNPEGPKAVTVKMPAATQFTRYSPLSPKTPSASQLSEIGPGDQARVIGQKSQDDTLVTADKVYSGAFRTVAGTLLSVSGDGKTMQLKDLNKKQPVTISLTPDSSIRKLPPEMASRMARHLNTAGTSSERSGVEAKPVSPGPRPVDMSQLLQRLPPLTSSDIKPGDALVVSGALASDKSSLIAADIIAGVEPIFQAAPQRQGQALSSDWSLDMAIPAQ